MSDTMASLEHKLAMARAQKHTAIGAKYKTEIVIDLTSPEGNIFYIYGLCKRLARELNLSDVEKAELENDTRVDVTKSYTEILDAYQQWFGLVYIGKKN